MGLDVQSTRSVLTKHVIEMTLGRADNDFADAEPGARHGACHLELDDQPRHDRRRRDGQRRVLRSERSERSRPAACYAARHTMIMAQREDKYLTFPGLLAAVAAGFALDQ